MTLTVLVVLLIAAAAVVYVYNRLVGLQNRVENSWRQIDVQLKRRHDLIPALVDAVKGALQFERDTLERVMLARARASAATSMSDRLAAEDAVTQALGRLLAVMENYPVLKSNENVLRLQEELTTTENQLAFTRQCYNDVVMQFNTGQQLFPVNLVAQCFAFKPAAYFAAAAAEHIPPRVDLSLSQ